MGTHWTQENALIRPLVDSSVDTDQFLDTVLEFPVPQSRQTADRIVATVYCILLGVYAAFVIGSSFLPAISWLLVPMLCSCNVVIQVLTGLLQRHLGAQVKKERCQGFLNFSDRLDLLIHLPSLVISCGNAALLLIVSWQAFILKAGISPSVVLKFILLMEILWTVALLVLYIWAVRTHGLSEYQPDAMRLLYSAMQPPTVGDLRCIDGGSLAEQQATLLRYQQENVCFLSEEILRLQETLGKYETSHSGSTPQVDMAHLLGAREQELRAVTAERDQLHGEIRLARNLIAERDSDILRVKNLNDKYVEENERLRAMLEEWSSRTAKLEIALEAEKLSNVNNLQKMK